MCPHDHMSEVNYIFRFNYRNDDCCISEMEYSKNLALIIALKSAVLIAFNSAKNYGIFQVQLVTQY